jgi:hypothetical protein
MRVRNRSKRSTSAVGERSTARLRQRPGLEPLEQRALPSFVPLVNYPDSVFAADLAVADFNRDGHPDLAVLNSALLGGQSVGLLLGAGNGMFSAAGTNFFGQALRSVAAADLNGDRNPDLIVVNGQVPGVSVLLGNGDGTFKAAINTVAGPPPKRWRSETSTGTAKWTSPWRRPRDLAAPAPAWPSSWATGTARSTHRSRFRLTPKARQRSSWAISTAITNWTWQPLISPVTA